MRALLAAVAVLGLLCGAAMGDLAIDVSPWTAGINSDTLWHFSGSGEVSVDGVLNNGDHPRWTVDDIFANSGATEVFPKDGIDSATVTNVTTSTTAPITNLYIDQDNFQIGFDVGSALSYSTGDTIAFNGEMRSMATLSVLDEQGLPYFSIDNADFASGGGLGLPAVDISISNVAVPEPSALLYGIAVAAMVGLWYRKRHR